LSTRRTGSGRVIRATLIVAAVSNGWPTTICWSRGPVRSAVRTRPEHTEPTKLGERGSRHPARAALVYLARNHTMATNAELAAVLGLSRAENVPNLTRRFADWLATDAKTRKTLGVLEAAM